MTAFKLGRLPALRPAALKNLEVYANGPLANPPATWEVPGQAELNAGNHGIYPIDCNDRLGDCVMAGVAHLLEAWNRADSEHDYVPTEPVIEAQYLKRSPGDEGLVEAYVLKEWQHGELFPESPLWGYAPCSTTSLLQQHQAVAFYGGLMLGIECPQSAQEQFGAGEPWTYVEASPVLGGHCVVALGYGPHGGLHCATWGGIAVLEASFLAHYLDEAWVCLPHQLVEAKKDSLGLNLNALEADLKRV